MHVTVLTTGGTIEKTYNERDKSLRSYHTILPKMLATPLRSDAVLILHGTDTLVQPARSGPAQAVIWTSPARR